MDPHTHHGLTYPFRGPVAQWQSASLARRRLRVQISAGPYVSRLRRLKEDDEVSYYVYTGSDPDFDEFELLAKGKDVMQYIQEKELAESVLIWDGIDEETGAIGGQVGFIREDVDSDHHEEILRLAED